jgi:probable phosphoglycerate mutase
MRGTIFLMRHGLDGDSAAGRDHTSPAAELTALGRQQIIATAKSISGVAPITIVSSTLRRARESAQILAEHLRLSEPISRADLDEWRAPSCVLGKGPEDYPSEYLIWQRQRATNPDSRCDDGETIREFYSRGTSATRQIGSLLSKPDPLLILSHKLMLELLWLTFRGISIDPCTAFRRCANAQWRFSEIRYVPPSADTMRVCSAV